MVSVLKPGRSGSETVRSIHVNLNTDTTIMTNMTPTIINITRQELAKNLFEVAYDTAEEDLTALHPYLDNVARVVFTPQLLLSAFRDGLTACLIGHSRWAKLEQIVEEDPKHQFIVLVWNDTETEIVATINGRDCSW